MGFGLFPLAPCWQLQDLPLFPGQSVFHLTHPTCLFTHLSIDEHLDCLNILTAVNNATINVGVQLSLQHPDFYLL